MRLLKDLIDPSTHERSKFAAARVRGGEMDGLLERYESAVARTTSVHASGNATGHSLPLSGSADARTVVVSVGTSGVSTTSGEYAQ